MGDIIMKTISWLAVTVLLAGCYVSPSVKEVDRGSSSALGVEIVPLTMASVSAANKSPYTPRSLPSVFRHVSPIPAMKSAGALPEGAAIPEDRPVSLETRVPPKTIPESYIIGVSDVLILATPSAGDTVAELSGLLAAQNKRQGYTVQDDGAIALPDVGRVQVAGMTLEEADASVFQSLVSAQINPSFSVEISEFNSQRVAIGGAVGKPTLVPISIKPLYLEEALQLAGGIVAPDMDYASVRLYRNGELYQIPLTELYAKKSLKRILLRDGDSVFIDTAYELDKAQAFFEEQIKLKGLRQSARSNALTELNAEFNMRRAQAEDARANFTQREELGATRRDYVYIGGEVRSQSRYTLPYEQTAVMADALYSNQGLSTREANLSQIYLLRGNNTADKVIAYHLNATNAANMMITTRMELRPNDIIFVSEQPVTRWNRLFEQIIPSLISTVAATAK